MERGGVIIQTCLLRTVQKRNEDENIPIISVFRRQVLIRLRNYSSYRSTRPGQNVMYRSSFDLQFPARK